MQVAAEVCPGPDGTFNGKNKHQIYSQIPSHGKVSRQGFKVCDPGATGFATDIFKENARADESRPSGMNAGLGHGLDVNDFLTAPKRWATPPADDPDPG